jgi:hypothetical protein
MKFSGKQLDDISRVLGTLASAALGGAAIGITRPEQISRLEQGVLLGVSLFLFFVMLRVQKGR